MYKYFFILIVFFSQIAIAQTGYKIEAEIDNYQGEQAFLAFRYGDGTYAKDTAQVVNGKMTFEANDTLATGIYLVLLPPQNRYFEFLISPNNQRFSIKTDTSDLNGNLEFFNSKENSNYMTYLKTMSEFSKKGEALKKEIKAAPNNKKKEKLQDKHQKIGKEVIAFQQKIINENQGTFLAKLVHFFEDLDIPETPKLPDGAVDSTFKYTYYKKHFFDHVDFSEVGFANSPFLLNKVNYYLDKVVNQNPDSVLQASIRVIELAKANPTNFRLILSKLVTKYYQPKIIGQDKVFVHLVNQYYKKGVADDWLSKEQLKKITDEAYMNNFVLIGKQAPNVEVQLYDYTTSTYTDKKIKIHDIKSEFLAVLIWKPGCGHCKKMTDELKKVYKDFKNQGLEVVAITSARHTDLGKAIKDIKAKEVTWINTADPYMKSRAMMKYYGTSLPRLYLLDKNKKIIASRIGAPQIPKFIEKYKMP